MVILFVVFVLAGCGHNPSVEKPPIVVYETKTVVVAPPAEMLRKIAPPTPPDPKEYVAATWPQKEDMLIKTGKDQLKVIGQLNAVIQELINWKTKQLKIHETK